MSGFRHTQLRSEPPGFRESTLMSLKSLWHQNDPYDVDAWGRWSDKPRVFAHGKNTHSTSCGTSSTGVCVALGFPQITAEGPHTPSRGKGGPRCTSLSGAISLVPLGTAFSRESICQQECVVTTGPQGLPRWMEPVRRGEQGVGGTRALVCRHSQATLARPLPLVGTQFPRPLNEGVGPADLGGPCRCSRFIILIMCY